MQRQIIFYLSCLLATTLFVQFAHGKCNACGENGIACIDKNSFHLCHNGELDAQQVFECPNGKVCTKGTEKCSDIGLADPDCSDNVRCGHCDGEKLFVCTSRTAFTQCNGTQLLTDITTDCPSGFVCNSSQAEICVEDAFSNGFSECSQQL